MKKIYAIVLSCLILGAGCTSDNDGLADRVSELEKEVNGNKSKTVIEIKKQEDQLVIVYSNGTEETIPFPAGIPGSTGPAGPTGPTGSAGADGTNGAAGKDGVGIKTLTYDQNSGVLTITLTNGEVSEFKIIDNGTDWKAVLIGDTNGRLFVTEALLGAVPVIKAGYNDDYQLNYLESNTIRDMQVRKTFDITKNFVNGDLDNYVTKRYATEDKTIFNYTLDGRDYNGDGIGLEPQRVKFSTFRGNVFRESNGDGTYTYYRYWQQEGAEFVYSKYERTLVLPSGHPEYYYWELIRKQANGEFYFYYEFESFFYADQRVFPLNSIATIQNVSAGAIESAKLVDIETDAQGRIAKQYDEVNIEGQSKRYLSYEYNSAGLVKTTKSYVKNSQNEWTTYGAYETYNYDSNNHLISIIRLNSDGTTQEVQKATYDKNGNPIEIWKWFPEEREYKYEPDPITGQTGYYKIIRPAGLHKAAIIEYDYTYKNFFGNTLTALVPQLEGYKIVNALKRVTVPNSYSYANIEYKDFNEYGYPGAVLMDASEDSEGYEEPVNLYLKLNYKIKSK